MQAIRSPDNDSSRPKAEHIHGYIVAQNEPPNNQKVLPFQQLSPGQFEWAKGKVNP